MKFLERYLNFQNLFVLIGLIMGVKFIYVNPPWQSNDEDRHFYNAYAISEGIIGPQYVNGKVGQKLPIDLTNTVRSYQGIPFSKEAKVDKRSVEKDRKKKIRSFKKAHFPNPSSGISPVGYIPASIGIFVAKTLNKGAIDIGYWARLFSLFSYLLIVYFAFRLLPISFQPVLFVVSLCPMVLYQAASVSYDTLTYSFLFLFLAFVIHHYFSDKKLSWKHIGILVAIAFLQGFVKGGYFILFFTVLVIPMRRFNTKGIYFALIAGLIIASFIPPIIWKSYKSTLNIPPEAFNFFQKDFRFDNGANLKFQLGDPVNMALVVIKNIFTQGKVWVSGVVGRFGYSYTLLPSWAVICWYFLFLTTACLIRKKVNWTFIIVFSALSLLNIAAIIGGFYLGSPVGANFIYGLQGRYFSPILPFAIFGLFNAYFIRVNPKMLRIGLSIIVIVLLGLSVNYLDGVFYLAN